MKLYSAGSVLSTSYNIIFNVVHIYL